MYANFQTYFVGSNHATIRESNSFDEKVIYVLSFAQSIAFLTLHFEENKIRATRNLGGAGSTHRQ